VPRQSHMPSAQFSSMFENLQAFLDL
jgi:hypothetical protein